jgi:acetyl esterase/lipase
MERRSVLTSGAAGIALLAARPLLAASGAPLADPDVYPPEAGLRVDSPRANLDWPRPERAIALWDKPSSGAKNPSMTELVVDEATDPKIHFRRVNGITRPRLCLFPAVNPNGGAMLIIPGGGFVRNYFDHEGYLLAEFLAKQGITCAVLFYRLAQDGWDRPADVGIIDAQRGMRVMRAMAQARQIPVDPKRIGVIGFSAGGFLAASLQTRYAHMFEPAIDAIDRIDARPMFAAPIYPVQSLDPAVAYKDAARVLFDGSLTPSLIRQYSPETNVTTATPPGFFVHCVDDDAVPQANSTRLAHALMAKGVDAEAHIFARGGHGFGFSKDRAKPVDIWPELLVNYAKSIGLTGDL